MGYITYNLYFEFSYNYNLSIYAIVKPKITGNLR